MFNCQRLIYLQPILMMLGCLSHLHLQHRQHINHEEDCLTYIVGYHTTQ
jgi:hypothetical protein